MKNAEEWPKCGAGDFSTSEVRMTGSGLSRFFDVQNKLFDAVSYDEWLNGALQQEEIEKWSIGFLHGRLKSPADHFLFLPAVKAPDRVLEVLCVYL